MRRVQLTPHKPRCLPGSRPAHPQRELPRIHSSSTHITPIPTTEAVSAGGPRRGMMAWNPVRPPAAHPRESPMSSLQDTGGPAARRIHDLRTGCRTAAGCNELVAAAACAPVLLDCSVCGCCCSSLRCRSTTSWSIGPPVAFSYRSQPVFRACDLCHRALHRLALYPPDELAVPALGFALCRFVWRVLVPYGAICVARGLPGPGSDLRSRLMAVLRRREEQTVDRACSLRHLSPHRVGGADGPDHPADSGRVDGVSVPVAPPALSAGGRLPAHARPEASPHLSGSARASALDHPDQAMVACPQCHLLLCQFHHCRDRLQPQRSRLFSWHSA